MSDPSAEGTTGGPEAGASNEGRPVVREMGAVGQLPVHHADPHPVDAGPAALAAADGRRLVPVLTYHSVSNDPPEPIRRWSVSPARMRAHLTALRRAGFTGLTVTELLACYRGERALPDKPVVLTFDDGYRPQFTYALPELRRHGWAGVLNLKAEGSDLYPSNVKAMIAAGWELAAHTIHHLDLTTLDAARLREETAGSRAILRREYGVPVRDFCYPSGRFDETVIAAVKAAGFTGATTEIPGYANRERPYELARFEVLRSTGVQGVAEDLRSG